MDLLDHLPPEPEETPFHAKTREAIEFGDMTTAGHVLTEAMHGFFSDYMHDETLYGLLKIANHIHVINVESNTCIFDTRKRRLSLPYSVALRVESMHDIACLLLIERNRLIIGRSVHVFMPHGMDLNQMSHKVIYDLALSCWSIALSRCFCASVLPEKMYAMYSDLFHNLMHGLVPDQLSEALKKEDLLHVADTYLQLYNMGGQEQYHAALNRVASGATATLPFVVVLEAFWEDFKKNAPSNEEIEQMIDAMIAKNDGDGEEERAQNNQKKMQDAEKQKGSNGRGRNAGFGSNLHAEPVVDVDVESDLDQHLAQFMRVSMENGQDRYYDRFHGMSRFAPSQDRIRLGFAELQHTVMLEADSDEDDHMFGQISPPEHPTTRDMAMYVQGYPPMLWETRMATASSAPADIRYDAYFDISGSMYRWLPVVRALLRNLGVYIRPNAVYGFSTEVTDIDMDASFLLTTGGTNINCAIKHAKQNNAKHLILITDLEDYDKCDTEGIEHIIIIATDQSEVDIADTVFSEHHAGTKIDVYSVMYDDLVKRTPNMGTFN